MGTPILPSPLISARGPSVVLVHGAIVRGWELILLAQRLRKAGFTTYAFTYQSMRRGLAENVESLRDFIGATPGETVHAVGHSMGGVLLRHVFESTPDPRPGRLVAVGSPFLDCWVARRGLRLAGGKLLTGRTVCDHLAGVRDSVWRGQRELGVIAGTYPLGIGSIFSGLPRPSDGVVLLEETRLGGIKAHLTCGFNHFGMLFSQRCADQIALFLYGGIFAPWKS